MGEPRGQAHRQSRWGPITPRWMIRSLRDNAAATAPKNNGWRCFVLKLRMWKIMFGLEASAYFLGSHTRTVKITVCLSVLFEIRGCRSLDPGPLLPVNTHKCASTNLLYCQHPAATSKTAFRAHLILVIKKCLYSFLTAQLFTWWKLGLGGYTGN